MNIYMKEFDLKRIWRNDSYETIFPNKAFYIHRYCLHGPISSNHSYDKIIQYFTYTIKAYLTYAWRSLVQINVLTKW